MTVNLNEHRKVWSILGLVFDEVGCSEAIGSVKSSVANNSDCFISTPNLNFVIAANSNETFFKSVLESELSLADGMPIIWVAKLLGLPISDRVAGSTLFEKLKGQTDEPTKSMKVFFFGGQAGIAKQAHEKLNQQQAYLSSCGYYDPGFVSVEEMSHQKIIEHINSLTPDFIVVALGAVKGQEWILKNKDKLTAPVISHLGAVINFVAGSVKRAPVPWQRFGLEWVWRIKQEPLLWKRYFFDGMKFVSLLMFKVLPLAIYDRYLKKRYSESSLLFTTIKLSENNYSLYGAFTVKDIVKVVSNWKQLIQINKNVFFEISNLKYIDSAGIAQLLLLQHAINKAGYELFLSGVTPRIRRILYLNNVQQRFNINKIEK